MSRKKKQIVLEQTGVTTEDKPVYGNIFQMYETYGIHFTDTFFFIQAELDGVPDCLDMYVSMKRSGIKHDRIVNKIRESYIDIYGKDFWLMVKDTLDLLEKFEQRSSIVEYMKKYTDENFK